MKSIIFIICLFFTLNIFSENYQLEFFDSLNCKFDQKGDKAWLVTGFLENDFKIRSTDISKDGNFFAIGDEEGNVVVYDLNQLEVLWKKQIYSKDIPVTIVKFNPNNKQLAVSSGYYANASQEFYILEILSGKTIKKIPVEVSPNPVCKAVGNTLDPIGLEWSSDGSTLFTLYTSHKLANTGDCLIAAEKYIYLRNFQTGSIDIINVALDPFKYPERDEPDIVWIEARQFFNISKDSKIIGVTSGNSRVCLYNTGNNKKLSLKKTSRAIYYWLEELGIDASYNGSIIFDSKGNIYTALGIPAGLANTVIVKLNPDMTKITPMAKVNEPLPKIILSPDENYLMVNSDIINLWDLRTNKSVFHGPWAKIDGDLCLFHPKKRAILLISKRFIYFLVERPRVKLNLTKKWQKTGYYVDERNSFFIYGNGRFKVGYGTWLRDSWFKDSVYFNEYCSQDDDLNEYGELQFLAETPGVFYLYGGKNEEEYKMTLSEFINSLPDW